MLPVSESHLCFAKVTVSRYEGNTSLEFHGNEWLPRIPAKGRARPNRWRARAQTHSRQGCVILGGSTVRDCPSISESTAESAEELRKWRTRLQKAKRGCAITRRALQALAAQQSAWRWLDVRAMPLVDPGR
jgi:hypothetical protein